MTPLLVLYLVGMAVTAAACKVATRYDEEFESAAWFNIGIMVLWPLTITLVLLIWFFVVVGEFCDPPLD